MVTIEVTSWTGKWFRLCVSLPFSSGLDKSLSFVDYLANGTTLCHLMWVVLWNPILWAGFTYGFLWQVVLFPFISEIWQAIEVHGVMAGVVVPYLTLVGIPLVSVLAVWGLYFFIRWLIVPKGGGTPLLVVYARAIKQKVCPLVNSV